MLTIAFDVGWQNVLCFPWCSAVSEWWHMIVIAVIAATMATGQTFMLISCHFSPLCFFCAHLLIRLLLLFSSFSTVVGVYLYNLPFISFLCRRFLIFSILFFRSCHIERSPASADRNWVKLTGRLSNEHSTTGWLTLAFNLYEYQRPAPKVFWSFALDPSH